MLGLEQSAERYRYVSPRTGTDTNINAIRSLCTLNRSASRRNHVTLISDAQRVTRCNLSERESLPTFGKASNPTALPIIIFHLL
jgi:hypothetical protein